MVEQLVGIMVDDDSGPNTTIVGLLQMQCAVKDLLKTDPNDKKAMDSLR